MVLSYKAPLFQPYCVRRRIWFRRDVHSAGAGGGSRPALPVARPPAASITVRIGGEPALKSCRAIKVLLAFGNLARGQFDDRPRPKFFNRIKGRSPGDGGARRPDSTPVTLPS